ncbi:hypothetical protein PCANC_16876 [Puccinia coronata f. sp. avenae]|uniref:C2H2-type domain-containing protein n=1 Tax=Puccinia coronata f. sp. avenae TaxID=200324 RepID=A0A2N5SHV6_9BASI|nr:hypothetical protein PCANC_16876 [Puccinia coronata f. sp. avenae]
MGAVHPLSGEIRRNIGTSKASPTVWNQSVIPSPLSSTIQKQLHQEVNLQLATTSSSHHVHPKPLFQHHASSTVTGEVHSAQSHNQYVCHGSLALGTYSRKPLIPACSMHPVSQTTSGPHHSGSVAKAVAMPSHFDNFSSTAASADLGSETRSRKPAVGTITSTGKGPSPPRGINSTLGHSTAFLNSGHSLQTPASLMGLGGCIQTNDEWLFASNFGAGVEAIQSSGYPTTMNENTLVSETSQDTSSLLSFINSNFPVQDSFGQASRQAGLTLHKNYSPAIGLSVPSSRSDLGRTPAASPSKLSTSVQIGRPEVITDRKFFHFNALENLANEYLKHEEVPQAQTIEKTSHITPYPPSNGSNHSSQFSSPSLSASSTSNSRAPSYSPSHSSTDLDCFDKTAFSHNSSTVLTNDFMTQNCFLGPPAGPFNAAADSNIFNLMPYDEQLALDSLYPLQHHIQQQQLLLQQLQLQQSWPYDQTYKKTNAQRLQQQLPEIDSFINPNHCSDGSSAHIQPPPILKATLICPKCGKGHTRQSNLLAHLRDTHSQVKKVLQAGFGVPTTQEGFPWYPSAKRIEWQSAQTSVYRLFAFSIP